MKTKVIIIAVLAIAVAAILFTASNSEPALAYQGELYKSATCGCCEIYGVHAQDTLTLDVQDTMNLDSIKEEYNIPSHLHSCHTTIVEGYFIEGHIPMRAVTKLLTEKPDIAGIALPGMPSGTPGMPGPKTEDWVITAVHHDGSTSEFMRI